MKTSELTGALLDYWVAKAAGIDAVMSDPYPNGSRCMVTFYSRDHDGHLSGRSYMPSEHCSDGDPIIEREGISVWRYNGIPGEPTDTWFAATGGVHGWDDGRICGNNEQRGGTALIAAMRAYVASKFGDEVPDEVTA